MPGIPREVAEHELRILPESKPVQQRLRRFDDERRRAIGEEIAKLLAAGFIKEVYHSEDCNAARRVARRAKMFVVIDDELYKRSPSKTGILMKCIPIAQGKELLLEIHTRICGHHAAPRSLVGKAFR